MENFVFGALSGSVGLLLSHPFDTIKTNLQESKPIKYNLAFLYRGFIPPLFGVAFEKAVVFGTYENVRKLLHNENMNEYVKIGISGACAGFNASLIVAPSERIKILMQTEKAFQLDFLHPKRVFNGLSATFWRETPGFAIYFTVYNAFKNRFFVQKNRQITPLWSFIFGGLAGTTAWAFIYPQDRIKTRMQANENNKKSFTGTFREIRKEGGMLGFYRGFHFALMRAVPLHAGTFMVMECCKKYFI